MTNHQPNHKENHQPDKITAVFICGPGSEEYIGYAITTLLETATYPDRFDFLIGFNKPLKNPDYFHIDLNLNTKNSNHPNKITLLDTVNHLPEASSSHMQSLTKALNYLETQPPPKVLIIDADIAFLHHGWDTLMESLLTPTNIMVGTAYPTKAEKKYQNFPTLYVALIDFPKFQELNINLMPDIDQGTHVRRIKVNTPKLQKYFGVPIGSTIKYDSGYQIPVKLKDANFTGTSFENREVASHIPPHSNTHKSNQSNSKYGIFTPRPPQATLSKQSLQLTPEPNQKPYIFYEMYYQNQLLFTHLGNSRNKDYHTHPEATYWRNICKNYIKNII